MFSQGRQKESIENSDLTSIRKLARMLGMRPEAFFTNFYLNGSLARIVAVNFEDYQRPLIVRCLVSSRLMSLSLCGFLQIFNAETQT